MNRLTSSWSLLAVASALLLVSAVKLWTDPDSRGSAPALILLGAGLVCLGIWIGLEVVRWITTGKPTLEQRDERG